MTNEQTYLDLAKECESATAGSRDLDVRIYGAVHHPDNVRKTDNDYWIYLDTGVNFGLPPFTTSLDAAYSIQTDPEYLSVCVYDLKRWVYAEFRREWADKRYKGDGATQALAVCAAKLRALAAQGDAKADSP